MKKIYLAALLLAFSWSGSIAQCSFETLFPLTWGSSKYSINEYYQSSGLFETSTDTIRKSAFEHGLDYLFTARNMTLAFYSYKNKMDHPCFKSGHIVLNCIANDSGLVAYNFQVTYPVADHEAYLMVIDSLKAMMQKKFAYNSTVKNPTKAFDANGNELEGEGVSVYFNDEPIISSNLTYPQFVIRAGFLATKAPPSNGAMIPNQAEDIQYYRIEILYKKTMPKW